MNSFVVVQPDPRRMIEGLRDTGYEFNTAIADVVDNSIAAKATLVKIGVDMDFAGNITISIADNGSGMDHDGLLSAMKYGSPPRPDRRSLGKFGLGLKTASTAFCRRLSVLSRAGRDQQANVATWDLDHVAQVSEWQLLLAQPSREETEILEETAPSGAGTVVIWEKVDRLLKDYTNPGGQPAQRALKGKIESLRDHLATVYQRFLDPNDEREPHKVRIWLNGSEVSARDPFCRGESELVASEVMPVLPEDGDAVLGEFTVRAFVLPRREEFASEEAAKAAQLSNENQGIYIYRENRLIHAADWLGMFAKEPHGTLLRVEFSFTAELDEALQVDIKKSKISLNEGLYEWLRDQFLPAPRRAANDRYRQGLRRGAHETAKGAHDSSNMAIKNKEADIEKAEVKIVDPGRNVVDVSNPYGTTRLVLRLSTANKPGQVFIQPVASIDDGLLWQPALIDGHQAVQVNSGHDYYRKVYLQSIVTQAGSTVTVQGLDSLLWALGVAELRAVNEDTKSHFSEMRFEISRILRKLVEHLPEPPEGNGNGAQ